MEIAWIYPHRDRCGIAEYASRYLEALERTVTVRRFDPTGFFFRRRDFIAEINRCDLAHIQYETSCFMRNGSDFFEKLCREITIPIFVSLHEVYRTFPDVFPREQLRGSFLSLPLKRLLYDRRHPLQRAYRRHLSRAFYAGKVLVHQEFHTTILEEQQVPGDRIGVLPLPIPIVNNAPRFAPWSAERPAHCVGAGYINPHYDYDLLFATLEKLAIPWRFTWIGGVRRNEDETLLEKILHMVRARGWHDRFQITGWLPEGEFNTILCTADVFCAFFTSRSSSATLAAAIGCLRPIVATAAPLTLELASRFGVLHCVQPSAEAAAAGIESVLSDGPLRISLETNVARYRERHDFGSLADQLTDLYKSLL
jgi:glycosyltransferase involved in cell wall biosynthesis